MFLAPQKERNTEVYRRGHNGPDSKSGSTQVLVGSNPTASAKNVSGTTGARYVFLYLKKVGFERRLLATT